MRSMHEYFVDASGIGERNEAKASVQLKYAKKKEYC